MGLPATSSIPAVSGEQIPIEWAYPGAEQQTWQRDTEHWPRPMPPMELWLHRNAARGSDRAWDEVRMDAPAMFYRFQYAGPFFYKRQNPYGPERMARDVLRYREAVEEHGGALAFWQRFCQPRIEQVCRELSRCAADGPVAAIAERWGYGLHQTFTSLALLIEPRMRLQAMLADVFGSDAALTVLEVVQGGDNATQAVDAGIWQLAEHARGTPAVARLLAVDEDGDALALLRREPPAAAFVAAFDGFIERHGARSEGWELTLPTWRERPETPLAFVRAQLTSGAPPPRERAAASLARRQQARDRALAGLPSAQHAEFSSLVDQLGGYVRIREDRAYWQMVLAGEVRGALLRIGEGLTASGALDRAADVLFLGPDDLERGRAGDLRPRVDGRRAEWEAWHKVVPPDVIGAPAPAGPAVEVARDTLRGSAASRGVVSGPARIIDSPEEGERLRPGDVLVCVMSTPAWTPLFGIVAGIVAETGGALSHPAITAREYGIPAVVGVKGATTRIAEGQTVTVDGGAGTVSL